ncbi:hypothetical protein R1sor_016580 [Riccia sorocarpa]|uniref:Phytocyanin domain-containing protein n=1 Tax=Riccia sorocarpa TaxID=122646 RepID=A0ABD3HH97_9MARC
MDSYFRKVSTGVVVVIMLTGLSYARYELPPRPGPATFVVGGDAGWRVGYDYKSWGDQVPVYVGDTLEFCYKAGKHTVTVVKDRVAFDHCDTSDLIEEHADGDTKITVKEPGWIFFVDRIHCSEGVKMATNILV